MYVCFSSSLRKGEDLFASLGMRPLSALLLWPPTLDCGSARRRRYQVRFSSSLRKGEDLFASLGMRPLSASLLWPPMLDCGSARRRRRTPLPLPARRRRLILVQRL
ncbi:hypothetical protein PVAP13_4KG374702 [Panicum virgatum]|uniref:Uncharacterized protein n=1 Tax=Panicum virgatum TaxID=38727 RepID=A0A8T0TY50_PANVG|nr:hypothetical protein PVAP13_4KG374702 [Panicum virgatum]